MKQERCPVADVNRDTLDTDAGACSIPRNAEPTDLPCGWGDGRSGENEGIEDSGGDEHRLLLQLCAAQPVRSDERGASHREDSSAEDGESDQQLDQPESGALRRTRITTHAGGRTRKS